MPHTGLHRHAILSSRGPRPLRTGRRLRSLSHARRGVQMLAPSARPARRCRSTGLRPTLVAAWLAAASLGAITGGGCASPYHADRGALAGGLGGAGVGALIGNAVGHTGAGAAIGAGVGTLAGAAVGGALDDIEARNRAQIAAQMGRPVPAGLVTFDDVIAMTRAGVDEDLIVNHIRANGAARPPQAADLIMLQQNGVSKRVIAALQTPPVPPPAYNQGPYTQAPYGAAPPGTPVIIEEHHYGPPWAYWHPPPPQIGFGFSFSRHSHCR